VFSGGFACGRSQADEADEQGEKEGSSQGLLLKIPANTCKAAILSFGNHS
jgi:hypothetical protein